MVENDIHRLVTKLKVYKREFHIKDGLITFNCDFSFGEFASSIIGCLAQIVSCIRFGCLVYLQGGSAIHKCDLGVNGGCDFPSVLHPLNIQRRGATDMAAKV